MDNQLTVILPTLNEAGNISRLIHEILDDMPGTQVIVVDDSSTDQTCEVTKKLISKGLPVMLIQREGKPCLTESIQKGITFVNTKYVAWMDADLSHPPVLIKDLFAAAKLTGCSIASRFIKGEESKATEEKNFNDTVLQGVLSFVLNFMVRKWLHLTVTDYTSGFIVCEKELLDPHPLTGDYGEYFIDLIYYFKQRNISITEIPYQSPARIWGESKTGTNIFKLFQRGIKYLWMTFRLRIPARKQKRPLAVKQVSAKTTV